MNKLKLMVDMDWVICDNGFLQIMNEFLGTNYPQDYFKKYYMQETIPKEKKKAFFKYFKEKNFYNYTHLYEGVYEALKELNDKYELYISTSFIIPDIKRELGYYLTYKFEYLMRELSFLKPENIIFVDDKINNLNVANKKILFTAYHNKEINDKELKENGVIRVNNWDEIKKML